MIMNKANLKKVSNKSMIFQNIQNEKKKKKKKKKRLEKKHLTFEWKIVIQEVLILTINLIIIVLQQ